MHLLFISKISLVGVHREVIVDADFAKFVDDDGELLLPVALIGNRVPDVFSRFWATAVALGEPRLRMGVGRRAHIFTPGGLGSKQSPKPGTILAKLQTVLGVTCLLPRRR